MAERGTYREWGDLRPELPKIVERLNADPELAIAAAANPLEALDELGYRIEPALRTEIQDRLRFRPAAAKQIAKLRKNVAKLAGRPFDPSDEEDTDRLLFDELKLARPPVDRWPKRRKSATEGEETKIKAKLEDRLEPLRKQDHPIVEPLLAYRALDASEPRFAAPDAYRAIRARKTKVPVTRIRVVLKDRG